MKTICCKILSLALLLLANLATANPTIKNSSPFSFTENIGQIKDQYDRHRADIDFRLGIPGINVFVGHGQLHYQWAKTMAGIKPFASNTSKVSIDFYRMDVTLVDANVNAELHREKQTPDHELYYGIGDNENTAYCYEKITYKNIYPNIDWVLYANADKLKYEFVVRQGGNANSIKLRFDGASSLRLQKDGSLKAITPFGDISEDAPYSYELETGKKVHSSFKVTGNTVQFDVDRSTGTVVIDPTIAWSTYYGGNNQDEIRDITVDGNGYIYAAGQTLSTTNLATTGAHQVNASSGYDGFITKFDGHGQRIWGTYFGGSGDEDINAITLDKFGNIYIGGKCSNTNSIITPGAHQTTYGGDAWDAFLAKFNTSGQRQWATYYGGLGEDIGWSVACDTNACIYLAGETESSTNIATTGIHQSTFGGGSFDAFLVKFYPNGQRHWGSYFGGSHLESRASVAISKINDVILVGDTWSTNGIATPGAYQQQHAGITGEDLFIAKFDSLGQRHISTYYGGSNVDRSGRVAIDENDGIYVTGYTASLDTIGWPTSHQNTPGGGGDVFIAKFNNSLQKQWGTYYGGSNIDVVLGMNCDATGNLFIGGTTTSTNNLTTSNAYQSTFGGSLGDLFLTIFNNSGQRIYGSYFGGSNIDQGICEGDQYGNIYIAGATGSSGLSTAGSFQSTMQGNGDAFIAKFHPDLYITLTSPGSNFCPGQTLNVNYITNTNFLSGNIFTAQLSDVTGSFKNPVDIGSVSAIASGTIAATVPASVTLGSGYRVRVISSNPVYASLDNNVNISLQFKIPSVTLSAAPTTSAGPGKTITLTANPVNGGSTPSYQWRKNGADIVGATNSSLPLIAGTDFVSGDKYSIKMTSSDPCAQPDTAVSIESALSIDLSVKDIRNNRQLTIYPNPAKDQIHVEGAGIDITSKYTIANTLGVTVQTGNVITSMPGKGLILLKTQLHPGNYYITVQTARSREIGKILIEK